MKLLMLGSGSYKSTLNIRLRDLARHLAATFDVTMIVPSADKYNNFTPDRSLKPAGIRVVQPWQLLTRSPMINLIPYLFSSLAAILRVRADVVYLYKPTPITILGLVPRALFRTPVILDMDDLGSEVMKLEGQSSFAVGLVQWCENLAMRYSSGVVVGSTYLESIVRQKHPGKRILVLPNGVEPTDYRETKVTKPRHAVYYFGALNRLSLIEDLLRAFPAVIRDVPDVKLTIVGGISALDAAKKLTRELAIGSHVTFTGWLDNMLAVQGHVQYADIGVCYQPDTQTVRAASNMKVFQYMAMRSVPVVSDVGDLKQYVQNGKAGVAVAAGNADALASILSELLLDDARRMRLANKAFELAQSEYSWQQRAARLSEFVQDLRKNKPPRA